MNPYIEKLVAVRKHLTGIKKHTVANAIELQRIRKKLMEMIIQELSLLECEKYKEILSHLLALELTLFKSIKHSYEFDSAKDILIQYIDETYVLYLEENSFEITSL